MENTHKRSVETVLGLGIATIKDARYTNCGNVVIYTASVPTKSTKISVTNALRRERNVRKVTWKNTRSGHSVFGTTIFS
jgi:hypothetical protein